MIKKGDLDKQIITRLHNAFLSIDLTKDMTLFDIKKIKGEYSKDYFRLRKGKYRAIFYFDANDIVVIDIGKREEVYKPWE